MNPSIITSECFRTVLLLRSLDFSMLCLLSPVKAVERHNESGLLFSIARTAELEKAPGSLAEFNTATVCAVRTGLLAPGHSVWYHGK